MAYTFTATMLDLFNGSYTTAIYAGAALTMITVVFLVFIDPDECNRVLEENTEEDDDAIDADLGESAFWKDEGGVEPVATS